MLVFSLFGNCQTQLQPAYVENVAEAITRATRELHSGMCYELGGPQVYIYRSLLEVIAQSLGTKPLLVPVPFELWRMFALAAELLPQPPVTRNQLELMQIDNVVSLESPGFADLQISPRSLEDVLPEIVGLSE
jgi:uncharacterized protein YbjT (DUF2867 family)